jgi:hypothetical protein
VAAAVEDMCKWHLVEQVAVEMVAAEITTLLQPLELLTQAAVAAVVVRSHLFGLPVQVGQA